MKIPSHILHIVISTKQSEERYPINILLILYKQKSVIILKIKSIYHITYIKKKTSIYIKILLYKHILFKKYYICEIDFKP